MPEILTFVMATEKPMPGLFGKLVLKCGSENADLSRVTSPAGMALLADHEGDRQMGTVLRLEARNGRITGEAEITETSRNAGYVEELRKGLRRGLSPGFIITSAEAVRDPDDDDEIMLVVTRYEPYEASTTGIERNPEAAVISLAERSKRASMGPDTADIEAQVNLAVKREVHEMEKSLADLRSERTAQEETLVVRKSPKAKAERASASSTNGKAATAKPEAENYSDVFATMLFGGPEPSGAGILDFTGQPGRLSSVKLAIDTTAKGIVTTEGGVTTADDFFETSPMRILALPRRVENLEGDMQVPTLTQEPNSAMVAQRADRLVVVNAILEPAPPTLIPHRLSTVIDYSLETTLIAPGFESWILAIMMTASDRHLATQILRGDGMGQNLTGIVNTTGVLETEYVSMDKGAQGGFLDAEDALGLDVPSDRRAWILAEDLFRAARRTSRDPGSGHYVARRWDGAMRVLDNSPAIRTNVLSGGYALYGEWSACTLGIWENVLITIDRIAQPGTLKITLDRYVDFAVTRASRFSILKEA